MTLAIATPLGIWADRKITWDDGTAADPMRKVAGNDALVASFAGGVTCLRKGLDAVLAGETDLEAIALASKGATGLVVKGARMYLLDDGLVWPRRRNATHYAIGSGGAEALAWLAGRRAITPLTIQAAHKYVARVRDDCGRGVDFIEAV